MKKEYKVLIGLFVLIFIIAQYNSVPSERTSIIGDKTIFLHLDEKNPTGYIDIGSDMFTPTGVNFICDMDEEYESPNPESSCWQTSVSFQDIDNQIMNFKDEIILNPYMNLKFSGEGDVRCDEEGTCELKYWDAYYKLWFTNKDFLQVDIIKQNTLYELGDEGFIEVQIRNDLANELDGGLYYFEEESLVQNEYNLKEIRIPFEKGTSIYKIPIKLDSIGSKRINIIPFFEINNIRFEDNRSSSIVLRTLPLVGDVNTSIDCTNSNCNEGFYCQKYITIDKTYHICEKGEEPELIIKDESIGQINVSDTISLDQKGIEYSEDPETKFNYWLYGFVAAFVILLIIILRRR